MSRDLTLVLPVHGRADQVLPVLQRLGRQAGADELTVVVADDASDPPVGAALVAPDGIRLVVARREDNGGPGAARNTGLGIVDTSWVAFMDADCLPADDWLGTATRLIGAPGAPDLIEGRVRIPADAPPTPFTHATEIAPPEQHGAGNVIFRTEVLRGAGGYDERFFDRRRRLHFREDTELFLRLEEAGASTAYEPELLADHPPLPPSLWGPVRLARRYAFDPLLAKLHPAGFREMNHHRRIGPVSLRWARHAASVAVVLGAAVGLVGLVGGWWPVALLGAIALVAGWGATAVALAWRRTVRPAHVAPLVVVAAVVPWVYLWSWWRGVIRHRYRPRL